MLLPEPYELVDLNHQASMTLRVDSWLDGSMKIHPSSPSKRHVRIHMDQRGLTEPPSPGTPIDVEIPMLRLVGQRLDEAHGSPYWDATSKTLRADLIQRFTSGLTLPVILRLTANGHKPHKRYSVEVL
jgi:hypothetical protein